ncbi:MAG: hypothetical protein AAF438_12485, partial [Pseudomonadota bacterium]
RLGIIGAIVNHKEIRYILKGQSIGLQRYPTSQEWKFLCSFDWNESSVGQQRFVVRLFEI